MGTAVGTAIVGDAVGVAVVGDDDVGLDVIVGSPEQSNPGNIKIPERGPVELSTISPIATTRSDRPSALTSEPESTTSDAPTRAR